MSHWVILIQRLIKKYVFFGAKKCECIDSEAHLKASEVGE